MTAPDAPVFSHEPWLKVFLVEGADGGRYARIVEADGRTGVAVLVLRGEEVALVEVDRPAIGRTALGVPRGFGDGDSPAADAVRELCEETGFEVGPDELVDLGVLHANDGLLAGEVSLFAVRVEPASSAAPRDDEVRRLRWVPTSALLDRLRDGTVTDGFTHAVVLRALLRGILQP